MQKANRFLCSTASQSSPSNFTVQTRKRSGTSSAGGDSLTLNREPGNAGDTSRTRTRSSRCNGVLRPSSLKNSRKSTKPGRVQRPNFRNLQNTVVLAPFHSLKKCYQTKLIDLYSFEKMKNISHKAQMARKKNASFEYDIIELKSSRPTIKKEEKSIKKQKQKSISPSYCQCKKTESKAEEKMNLKNFKPGRKTSRKKYLVSKDSDPSEQLKTKRKKLNGNIFSPIMLKSELSPRLDSFLPDDQFNFSYANMRESSTESSKSKSDSWETYSNSPFCREEHMEGSLAISTTSFDSYLDYFDKSSRDHSDSGRRYRKRKKYQKTMEGIDANFPPKPEASSSRHLIMHVEKKNSDGQIMDFVDREPQTQVVSSSEPNHQLQPFRRQSKTKSKKPENESVTGYYLRSLSSSKEEILQKENQELQDRRFSAKGFIKNKALQIEAATQVEENSFAKGSSISFLEKYQESTTSVYRLNMPSEETPEKRPSSSSQKTESLPRSTTSNSGGEVSNLSGNNPLGSQRSEERLNILKAHSDRASTELKAALCDQFQGRTNSQQPQDNGTDFIFGSKNTEVRLGESCEFSFGRNWILSDDED